MRARLMHAGRRAPWSPCPSSPEDIAEHLTARLDLAAVNDPGSCVVAGPQEAILLSRSPAAQGILARRVRTSHAFHSQPMDPVLSRSPNTCPP